MTGNKTTLLGRRIGVNEQKRKEARSRKIKSGVGKSVRWFGRRGWIIAVIVAVLGIVGWQERHQLQRLNPLELRNLRYIDIEGNRMLSWEDVVQSAQIETGMRMSSVNVDSVEQALVRLPLIHGAVVEKSFPSTVTIKIRETSPVFSVFEGSSIVAYSEKGLPMSIARASAMRLPVLDSDCQHKVTLTARFLTVMREFRSEIYERVSQVSWSEKDNAFVVYFKDAGYRVLFPSSGWTKEMFALYDALGKGFNNDLRCAGEVDLRFPGFAYVRNFEKRCVNG